MIYPFVWKSWTCFKSQCDGIIICLEREMMDNDPKMDIMMEIHDGN